MVVDRMLCALARTLQIVIRRSRSMGGGGGAEVGDASTGD